MSTKLPLQAEKISIFFGEDTGKNTAQNASKHAISSKKIHFFY